jgi:hypothetical protein
VNADGSPSRGGTPPIVDEQLVVTHFILRLLDHIGGGFGMKGALIAGVQWLQIGILREGDRVLGTQHMITSDRTPVDQAF